MKDLGYHDGYRYAHDEPEAFAAGEQYLPEGLEGMRWYEPTDRGLEIKIRQKLEHRKKLNAQAQSRGERDGVPDARFLYVLNAARLKFSSKKLKINRFNFKMSIRDSRVLLRILMLDINMLRKQLPEVIARLATRPFAFPEKEFNALENERKEVQTKTEELQKLRNQLSKQIGMAKKSRGGRCGFDG